MIAMAMVARAQVLIRRGRSLMTNSGCSTLPELVTSRIVSLSLSQRLLSTNITDAGSRNGAADGAPPSRTRRRPQSFVQPGIDLELGELETELPPGYHQDYPRKQRGLPKPRHQGDGRDSYWRPPWRNPRAEIISAEDFANRPRVSFSESFASMHDAMAVLSWMPQKDKDHMYEMYTDLMKATADKNEGRGAGGGNDVAGEDWGALSARTSHEYVVRVVAQKFNVTTSRAAGVIQLQHNEEQLMRDPEFRVRHDVQAEVDRKMKRQIEEVYESYGEKNPLQFVEDPVASTGNVPRVDAASPRSLTASDLTDFQALMRKTRMRELEDHKIRIANHVYVEDVDDRARKVKIDQEVRRLLRMQGDLAKLYDGFAKSDVADDGGAEEAREGKENAEVSEPRSADTPGKKNRTKVPKLPRRAAALPPPPAAVSPYPENNAGHKQVPQTRRPRWKYAAQIINTRMMENPPGSKRRGKAAARRAKGRRHGRVVDGNTVIEEGGVLRVASVAELGQTSWKHVRNESEVMFRGVKEAWLRRQLEGEVDGWGRQKEVFGAEEPQSAHEGGGGDGNSDVTEIADGKAKE